jgi:hypothetical protein
MSEDPLSGDRGSRNTQNGVDDTMERLQEGSEERIPLGENDNQKKPGRDSTGDDSEAIQLADGRDGTVHPSTTLSPAEVTALPQTQSHHQLFKPYQHRFLPAPAVLTTSKHQPHSRPSPYRSTGSRSGPILTVFRPNSSPSGWNRRASKGLSLPPALGLRPYTVYGLGPTTLPL